MTLLTRRKTLGLLGSGALTACSPAISTSELGDDPFEGGIGGTGIVGLMTGNGSVLVNGLRVEVTSSTGIFSANRRTSDSLLVPGRTLTLLARARLGRFEAKRIDIDDPLTGVLLRQGTGFSVNSTPLIGAGDVSGRIGERVTVSGIWQADGTVQTSLVHPASVQEDTVSGVLGGSATDGWRIGQTPITPSRKQGLIAGQFAVAKGVFTHGTLQATSLQFGRFREGGDTLRQLSVEGYLETVASAPASAWRAWATVLIAVCNSPVSRDIERSILVPTPVVSWQGAPFCCQKRRVSGPRSYALRKGKSVLPLCLAIVRKKSRRADRHSVNIDRRATIHLTRKSTNARTRTVFRRSSCTRTQMPRPRLVGTSGTRTNPGCASPRNADTQTMPCHPVIPQRDRITYRPRFPETSKG